MNTRNKILDLLSRSEKPLGPKTIASELRKSSANIRKILSNLYKEGKVVKVGFGEYKSSVNVLDKLNKSVNVNVNVLDKSNKSVNVEAPESKKLINEEINKYRKEYFQRLKAKDPKAYEKIKKARREYYKNWRADHPGYNKKWLSAYRKKHPEKFRVYEKRYWLKKALSGN